MGVGSQESTGIPYLLMQRISIRESPSLIVKCVFAEAHTAVQLLHESPCLPTLLSSLLPLFLAQITLGKQCHASFIKMPFSHCPKSLSLKGEAWLISTSLCSWHERQQMPELKFCIYLSPGFVPI